MNAETKPTDAMLPLRALRFGHDQMAGAELNARSSGRLDRIDEMVAMLTAQGQLYPLLVVENPTGKKESAELFFVAGGNRRLAALRQMHGEESDLGVPCKLFPRGTNMYELSIAENNTLPLHPVDRYRALAELIRREKFTPERGVVEMAARFGMTEKEAKQSLALGALADEVLDAWLAGTIGAEQARAFTLEPSKPAQAKLLAAARKNPWMLQVDSLLGNILGKNGDASKYVALVGPDAYRKAGGAMTEDLFGTDHVVHHQAIAKKLADERLAGICKSIVDEDDWKWAEVEDAMPKEWKYAPGWGRIDQPNMPKLSDDERARLAKLKASAQDASDREDNDAEDRANSALTIFETVQRLRAYKPADKARSGVVVGVSDYGEIRMTPGVVKPGEKKAPAKVDAKTAKKAKKTGPAKPGVISAALAHRMSVALTKAVAEVINAVDHDTASRIAVAGLSTTNEFGRSRTVCLTHSGMLSREVDMKTEPQLADELAKVSKMRLSDLFKQLAKIVAMSIDLQTHDGERMLIGKSDDEDNEAASALVHFLPADMLQPAIIGQFDQADYFASAPSSLAISALVDMGVDPPKNVKKKMLADLATDHAMKTRWLPPQLRTKDYDGPAAKPAPKKPKAKPAKKKRT